MRIIRYKLCWNDDGLIDTSNPVLVRDAYIYTYIYVCVLYNIFMTSMITIMVLK